MKETSGVILLNKFNHVLILKPSGTINKDAPWSIPKGQIDENEEPIDAAVRELEEEAGIIVEPENLTFLGESKYKSGKKKIYAFLAQDDQAKDMEPTLNWENSDFAWVSPEIAMKVVHEAQAPFLRLLM